MSSEFLLALTGVQAQDESVSISGNMRWSYEKRMKSGDFITCRAPYGYDLVNGTLVINETEAQVVKEIFEMFLLGISKPNIAKYLNSHGILPKHEKVPWSAVTVGYILRNERYIGDALLQKNSRPTHFRMLREGTMESEECITWRIAIRRLSAGKNLKLQKKYRDRGIRLKESGQSTD